MMFGKERVISGGILPDHEPPRPPEVQAATDMFVDVLQGVSDLARLPPDRVWFGGFDQGARAARRSVLA